MAAKGGPLFTYRHVPLISAMLARKSIDASTLLKDVGLPPDALRGEITAPLHRIQAFVDRAAKELEHPLFGFDLAASLPGGVYGVAEFLVRSAPNVESGLQVLSEFAALINPIGSIRFTVSDAEGALHYSVASERETLGRHLNEFTIAYIVRGMNAIVDAKLPLLRVWFSHAAPPSAEVVTALEQRFGCQIHFRSTDCGFAVTRAALATAPRTSDPLLHEFLREQARAQLAYVGPVDIVTQLVRVLEARLVTGDLNADAVARAMATTPRSLQRHLAEAGTTYRDVLAHVRNRRRAELARGGVAEAQIATQLGFSDVRSMRRSLDE